MPARDAGTILLLRHRAIVFELLGASLVGAAFIPGWRTPALVGGGISALSFLVLAAGQPQSAAIQRVIRAKESRTFCLSPQHGFQVYLHNFIVDADGNGSVVQQGMDGDSGHARRACADAEDLSKAL